MAFTNNFRMERVYFEKLKGQIDILKSYLDNETDDKIKSMLKNGVDADGAILLLYRNLGECWAELSELIKKADEKIDKTKEEAEKYHDELNQRIDEVNNYIMALIRELENRMIKPWSIPAEPLEYYVDEYGFKTVLSIANYNGLRGSELFTFSPADYQKGILYDISVLHDASMNALLQGMPNNSTVSFFVRIEPYYQTSSAGYNGLSKKDMFSIHKDGSGHLDFAPAYSSMGQLEIKHYSDYLRLLPSAETLKMTYQVDCIYSTTISSAMNDLITNTIKNSFKLTIKN